MGNISFNFLVDLNIPFDNTKTIKFIEFCIQDLGFVPGKIEYNFVSKKEILKINQEFLNHNYYTDIITFDSSFINIINGEIFISSDVVMANALKFKVSFEEELYRVVIHGIIHLCKFNDRTDEEKMKMRLLENKYLSYLEKL